MTRQISDEAYQRMAANLKPNWTKEDRPRVSTKPKNLERAIRLVRDAAPVAVEYLTSILKNPDVPMVYRIRCAETLLDKALGRGDKANQVMLHAEQAGPHSLRIVFVAPETNYDERQKPVIEETAVELQWSDAPDAKDAAKDG